MNVDRSENEESRVLPLELFTFFVAYSLFHQLL